MEETIDPLLLSAAPINTVPASESIPMPPEKELSCKKLVQMSCLGFKFQGMYLPSEILPELRGALALFILKATDI
jgi:hypothetical protein